MDPSSLRDNSEISNDELLQFRALVDSHTKTEDVLDFIQRSSASQQQLLHSELVKQVRSSNAMAEFAQIMATYAIGSHGDIRGKISPALLDTAIKVTNTNSNIAALYSLNADSQQLTISTAEAGYDFDSLPDVLLKKCAASGKTCAGRDQSNGCAGLPEICVPIMSGSSVVAVLRLIRLPSEGASPEENQQLFCGPEQLALEQLAKQASLVYGQKQQPSPLAGNSRTSPRSATAWGSDSSLIEAVNSWSYNVWDYEPAELQRHICIMYEQLGLIETFCIDKLKLGEFVKRACMKYQDVPFHNWRHAACVTHIAYFLIQNTQAGKYLDPIHHLVLLTAAICHDLDHPGTNNAFQVNSRSDLALRYNDISVLENHHSSMAWDILYAPGADILSALDAQQFKKVRDLMISSILMTDMKQHFSLLGELKGMISNDGRETGLSFDEGKEEEAKALITKVILHSADLSNPTRPWELTLSWGRLVGEEFESQVLKETELGISVSTFMHCETEEERANNEIGFIKGLIVPWWDTVSSAFSDLGFINSNISKNITHYQELAAAAKAEGK